MRTDDEILEEYGDRRYVQLGDVEGRAVVEDSAESIYLPATYEVEDVEAEEGADVSRLVSYEGLYCDMFDPGDIVEFSGVLERVVDGGEAYRVVVGGAGSKPSYIRRAA